MACCNQKHFPWYECTRSVCRVHMLAKTQAWHEQKSRQPGPAPMTRIVWNPNVQDNETTTNARKTPVPAKHPLDLVQTKSSRTSRDKKNKDPRRESSKSKN
ncbi:hypothetical protein MCOR04_011867 [Pyricularia oryzae]|nr:hypothetical protein MCOR04_011867 [Pyricularia oryzae]